MSPAGQDRSLYDVLEVRSTATFEEIDQSYARIAAYLDADSLAMYSLMDEEDVASMRADVDEAYRTLSDPDRRAAYDRFLTGVASSYPSVVVPEAEGGTSISIGRIETEADDWRELAPARTAREEPAPVAMAPETAGAPAGEEPPPVAAAPEAAGVPAREEPPPVAAAPEAAVAPAAPTKTAAAPAAPSRAAFTRAPPPARKPPRRVVPALDVELNADTEFGGSLLRRLRESAGATLQEIADVTKIRKGYLRALEENDFDSLPAAVYVRGFISEYARVLGLDNRVVAKSYMALYQRYKTGEGE
jgi:hypothetical protein